MTFKKTDIEYFPALTGIRAVAAYAVFLHHYKPFKSFDLGHFGNGVIDQFYIGVSVFFVLSGFLIAYRYMYAGPVPFKEYMLKRFARIYPVYFLFTTLTFLISRNIGTVYFLNITFLRGFFEPFAFSGIAQGWSLTVEEMFYLFAPFSFFLLKKSLHYLWILPVVLFTAGGLLVFIFHDKELHGFFGSLDFMLKFTFFGRATEFYAGILLAILYKRYKGVSKTKHCTIAGLAVIIIGLLALQTVPSNIFGLQYIISIIFIPLFGITLFFWGLLTERTIIQRVLGSKFFVLLGKSSYTFYLIHMGIVYSVLSRFTTNIGILFVLINIISILVFRFIEEPANNFLRRKYIGKII